MSFEEKTMLRYMLMLKNIFLVDHNISQTKHNVMVTTEAIKGTFVQYCDLFNLESDLDQALAIVVCFMRMDIMT